jgi:hypothetical protein
VRAVATPLASNPNPDPAPARTCHVLHCTLLPGCRGVCHHQHGLKLSFTNRGTSGCGVYAPPSATLNRRMLGHVVAMMSVVLNAATTLKSMLDCPELPREVASGEGQGLRGE